MTELTLHGGDVPGLLHNVLAHRVARRVGRSAFDTGALRNFIPDVVDNSDSQPPVAVRVREWREEECRRVPLLIILWTLTLQIIADCLQAFVADLVAMRDLAL